MISCFCQPARDGDPPISSPIAGITDVYPHAWPIYTAFFFTLVVLGFERGASWLLGWCSTIWATPPALYALAILEIWSHFSLGWPELWSSCLCFLCS
jgi:hypothetical protein